MNIGELDKEMLFDQPRTDLWEYLLVAHPDRIVNDQIKEEKKYFFDEYSEEIAIKTQPHITIANFLAKEEMENTLIRWIQRVCNNQSSFITVLNNFSGFPPHTIYLRVQDPQPFKQLAKDLKVIKNFIESNGCPPVRLISSPHLTIARRLPEHVYLKAIQDYAARLFHASFIVNEITLIKRRHQYDRCKPVNIFPFPPQIKNLFN